MSGFIGVLNKFAEYRDISRPSVKEATVAVTERYARKKLGIKKDEPLMYRGLSLRCIGSKLWRERNERRKEVNAKPD